MQKMSVISIIVPIYNTAKYLPRCIDSILAQTYNDLDIILLDDGSDDDSYEIMNRYAQKDARIRAFKLSHHGITPTRKKGIELAKGELIGFIDSDDYIEPDMYSRLYETMENNNCDLVSSDILVHNLDGQNWTDFDNYAKGLYTNLPKNIYPTMLHDFQMNHKGLRCYLVSKLFRANILKSTAKYIDNLVFYGEDAMILYRYCLNCKNIYIMRESFYHYDRHLNSAETEPKEGEPENMYRLFKNLKEAFEVSPYADILMPQLYQYAILLSLRVFRGVYGVSLEQINQWSFYDLEKTYNKRIAIYGAGACGRALCKELWKNGHANDIVVWVDKHPENMAEWEERYKNKFQNTTLMKAQDVSSLKTVNYDYVIVAIKKENAAKEAVNELQEMWNVPIEKILPVKVCRKNLAEVMLSAYL